MALRRVDNPPNPYLSEARVWLEEPPEVQVEVYEEHARSIISENDSPDVPFRYSVNPYRGCQHACAYCYARLTHEYLGYGAGTDFDTKIVVKVNAPSLLRRELARLDTAGEALCFSGVTDCYQPLEAVYELTRKCLEVCRDVRQAVSIVTKSYLVVRDAGLLADLAQAAGATVFQSIAFVDDQTARVLEPHAPTPARRFEAMQQLTAAGLRVGVFVAPIIPGLNDREIPAILERAAACGATSAGFVALRLPASVAPVFLKRLKRGMPRRAGRIEARIREIRGGWLNEAEFGRRMGGEGPYWQSIRDLFLLSARRYGLAAVGCAESAGGRDEDAAEKRRPAGCQRTGDQMLLDFPAPR